LVSKTRVSVLPAGENRMITRSFVSTRFKTDMQRIARRAMHSYAGSRVKIGLRTKSATRLDVSRRHRLSQEQTRVVHNASKCSN